MAYRRSGTRKIIFAVFEGKESGCDWKIVDWLCIYRERERSRCKNTNMFQFIYNKKNMRKNRYDLWEKITLIVLDYPSIWYVMESSGTWLYLDICVMRCRNRKVCFDCRKFGKIQTVDQSRASAWRVREEEKESIWMFAIWRVCSFQEVWLVVSLSTPLLHWSTVW